MGVSALFFCVNPGMTCTSLFPVMQTADYTMSPLRATVHTHVDVNVHILEQMCWTTNTTEGVARMQAFSVCLTAILYWMNFSSSISSAFPPQMLLLDLFTVLTVRAKSCQFWHTLKVSTTLNLWKRDQQRNKYLKLNYFLKNELISFFFTLFCVYMSHLPTSGHIYA